MLSRENSTIINFKFHQFHVKFTFKFIILVIFHSYSNFELDLSAFKNQLTLQLSIHHQFIVSIIVTHIFQSGWNPPTSNSVHAIWGTHSLKQLVAMWSDLQNYSYFCHFPYLHFRKWLSYLKKNLHEVIMAFCFSAFAGDSVRLLVMQTIVYYFSRGSQSTLNDENANVRKLRNFFPLFRTESISCLKECMINRVQIKARMF